ncbi:MAG: insulinase family protein [Defluviitaleaceae bacterium]|nr:insulinase family protein [Defluviitaleaceae bacterium]
MEVRKYEKMGEQVYYEKLENGLHVYLMPKTGFNKTYATFTTKYGSIDNHFIPLGQDEPTHVPDGIAHFLEHKLFEKEDYDVFQKFSAAGASSNAFTSFTRTCYLFSTTSDVEKNLTTLLDFVQAPYFTEATVEKEKGIIEEEIKMYEDNADFKAYFGVLNNLYVNHPIKIDIAGTVESIYEITAADLHVCYETFYHPSNMILFVVGDIEPESLIEVIRANQDAKSYTATHEVKRFFPEEPAHVAIAEREINMQVSIPKVFVGAKGVVCDQMSQEEILKIDLALDVILEMLFGSSSDYYEKILAEELANDSFGFEAIHDAHASFCLVGGDTHEPEALAASIKEKLLSAATLELNEAEFLRIKRKKTGQFLSALNSVEFIANRFTEYAFNGLSLFDVVDVLEDLQLADALTVARDYFKKERLTVLKMVPAG